MSSSTPPILGHDGSPSPSTEDSESGDEREAGTPLRDTMGRHRVDAIDSIMQSFCAVLDSKIALVKKTAVIKVEPDLDSSPSDLHVLSKSESTSPVLQRKGLAPQPLPKKDYSPKPATLAIKNESKKTSSFGPRLVIRRAPAPPLPPPPPARRTSIAPTSSSAAAPSTRTIPPPPPPARRRFIPPTSSSAAGPSTRTIGSSSLSTTSLTAVAGSAPPPAPPSARLPVPPPAPASAGSQGSVAEQTTSVFPPFFPSNILHNQFFHLPPSQTSSAAAPPSYDSISRSSLGLRALAQSLQQEPYEPDPTLDRGIQVPSTGTLSSSGAPLGQRGGSFRSVFTRRAAAPRDREGEGRAEHQGQPVVAQFQGFNGASDLRTALGASSNHVFRTSAQPAGPGLINLVSTRGPNQGPQASAAVEPGTSSDFDFGHGASTNTYLDIPEESFLAPGSTAEAWDIYDQDEQDVFRTRHEYQMVMASEPQLGVSQLESIEHASVSESTQPKPITPKAPDRDGRRSKRQKGADDSEPRSGEKKFACPYYKRNRKKYSKWTSCPGPGWEEVHRVKTHLYRRHGRPPQCPRCWTTFSTDDSLHFHLQQNPPCETGQNQVLVEGFSKEQEKKLRSRKKAQPNMTDEDKWRDIYMILFPDDDKESIPTPYYDETDADADESSPGTSGDLEDYATFVRREMPTLVRRELEVLFENEFKDVEERLRPRVAEIVLNLQPKLLNLYKQSQTPLSEYGPPPPEQTPGSGSEPVSHTTGTDTNSTPGTGTDGEDNAWQGAENVAYFNPTEMFGFDVNSMGAGFDWDGTQAYGTESTQTGGMPGDGQVDLNWNYEFDQLLNPVLFSPPSSALLGQTDSTEGAKRKYDADYGGF